MAYCSECRVRRANRFELGDLIVEDSPSCVFWRGEPLDLPPAHVRIMFALVKRPIVSSSELQTVASKRLQATSIRTHITVLRAALPPEIEILSVYGKGYALRVQGKMVSDDAARSTDPVRT